MNFRPMNDRVLIKKDDGEETTASGIIMPTASIPTTGAVLAVGPKVSDKGLKLGARVLFGPRGGTEIKLEGQTLHLFREEDLYGIFEKK